MEIKIAIFENLTNHGESIRHKSRVTRIKKIPQSQIMKKKMVKER